MMHCSSCDCPLPDATMRCTRCGEEVILPAMTPSDVQEMKGEDRTIATQSRFSQKCSVSPRGYFLPSSTFAHLHLM